MHTAAPLCGYLRTAGHAAVVCAVQQFRWLLGCSFHACFHKLQLACARGTD